MNKTLATKDWLLIGKRLVWVWIATSLVFETFCWALKLPYTILCTVDASIDVVFAVAEIYVESHTGRRWALILWIVLAVLLLAITGYQFLS